MYSDPRFYVRPHSEGLRVNVSPCGLGETQFSLQRLASALINVYVMLCLIMAPQLLSLLS